MMKPISIGRSAYAMEMSDMGDATITMYGEVVEERPDDGSYIVQGEFLADLEQLSGAQTLTIRMNSVGGDAGVSVTIHNRLRELARAGVALTCIVDGVAMSGGSLIMCACDTVKVNPASLIMIHKASVFVYGGYNADELREAAQQLDAYDKAQVAIYQRKTGLSNAVLSHMMSDTTYMTGAEAVDKGFADELLQDAAPLDIAASADRQSIHVNGHTLRLECGCLAPESLPVQVVDSPVNPPQTADFDEGGVPMSQEVNEQTTINSPVEAQAPVEAVEQIGATVADVDAVQTAVRAEQKRLQEIDAIASLFPADLVQDAKYGDTCTAQELTYRAAQRAVAQGKQFLNDVHADNAESGTANVQAVADPGAPKDTEHMTPEQRMTNARAAVKALFNSKEG